jgi:hypothetical protein
MSAADQYSVVIPGADDFRTSPELNWHKFLLTVCDILAEQNPSVDVIAMQIGGSIMSAGNASQERFCSPTLWRTIVASEAFQRTVPEYFERYVYSIAPAGADADTKAAFTAANKHFTAMKAAIYNSLPDGMLALYRASNKPPPGVAQMLDDIVGAYSNAYADAQLIKLIREEIVTDAPLFPAVSAEFELYIQRLSASQKAVYVVPETMINAFIDKLPLDMRSKIHELVNTEFPLPYERTWTAFTAFITKHLKGAYFARQRSPAHVASASSAGASAYTDTARAAAAASRRHDDFFCHACDAQHDPTKCSIVSRIVQDEPKFYDKLLKDPPGPTAKVSISCGLPSTKQWLMKFRPGWGPDYRLLKPASDRGDTNGRGGDSRGATNGRGGGEGRGRNSRPGGGRQEGRARFADAAASDSSELDGPAAKPTST